MFWYWSQVTFILSELHATDRGFKPVIGLSPGYGACPHIPDIALILHHCCVPAAGDCNKGCEWLRGTALRCPALTFSTSPLFNSLTSGLTWTDRLPIYPLSVPHSHSSIPCISSLKPPQPWSYTENEPQEVQDQLLTVSWQTLDVSVLSTSVHPCSPNHTLSCTSL